MKYVDAVFLQAVGWAVALVLAALAKKLPGVKRWLSEKPWRIPFFAAVLVSGLLNAITLWLMTSSAQADIQTLKTGLATWGGGNKDVAPEKGECPDGHYVVAISQESLGGGSSGYLGSISFVCRPLNVR